MNTTDAIGALRAAAARTADTCDGVADEIWYARLAPGGYSMADVTEHMADANAQIFGALTLALTRGARSQPFSTVADEETPFAFIRNGEPPGAAPSPRPLSQAAAVAKLSANVAEMAEWAEGVDVDLRTVGLAHPAYGALDGTQWILLAVAHIEMHRGDLMLLKRGVSPSAGPAPVKAPA